MSTPLAPAMARRIELWPLDRLVPYAKNARTHSNEQVSQIAASIAEFGFNAPILDFLDVNDADVRGYLLDDSPIFDFVRKAKVEALIAKNTLPNSQSKFLFNFLNCKMFLEEFAA